MNERRMQFRVGLVVFATMIVGGLMASFNGPLSTGWLPWGRGWYKVGIEVPQAPGVDANTPVRKNGVLIGRVKSIEDQGAGVLINAEIYGKPLYADFEPHIRTTVLGDATIDFMSRQPTPGQQPVPEGTVFRGFVDPNPFESLGQLGDLKEQFSAASQSLAQAGDEVSKLAKRVNVAFGDETSPDSEGRMKRLLDTTETAMNQFAHTMHSINQIIGDEPIASTQPGIIPTQPGVPPPVVPPPGTQPPGVQPPGAQPPGTEPPNGQQLRQRIRQGLNEFPDVINEFRLTMRESRVVLQSAEKNLKNLEAFTEPLGQKGGDFAASILRTVEGLDQIINDLGIVARALNDREGTVGKLIHDPLVYENLKIIMQNANKLLCDIDQMLFNLRPVVHDARIFMDKVATEPGRIVSGAVNPSNTK
jgi:phospholipid/cholesterol/gamma-HCH transport system substrate-binding protein